MCLPVFTLSSLPRAYTACTRFRRNRRCRVLLAVALSVLALASCTWVPVPESSETITSQAAADLGCTLVWSDEFDDEGLPDATRWRYNVGAGLWGNQESQFYTDARLDNARVEDGRLIIEAHREPWRGRQYTSARLVSQEAWTYGRFEIAAKLPSGRGTWPAIWLLPDLRQHGGWPLAGEIDIMEHVGHDPDRIHATVHTAAFNHMLGTHKGASTLVPTARSAMHLYSVEWTPSEIRGFVDELHYFTFANERLHNADADERQWPFDHPFHLILNIAVGGSWGGQQGIDRDIWPQRMEIDFVRIYDCEW